MMDHNLAKEYNNNSAWYQALQRTILSDTPCSQMVLVALVHQRTDSYTTVRYFIEDEIVNLGREGKIRTYLIDHNDGYMGIYLKGV